VEFGYPFKTKIASNGVEEPYIVWDEQRVEPEDGIDPSAFPCHPLENSYRG